MLLITDQIRRASAPRALSLSHGEDSLTTRAFDLFALQQVTDFALERRSVPCMLSLQGTPAIFTARSCAKMMSTELQQNLHADDNHPTLRPEPAKGIL